MLMLNLPDYTYDTLITFIKDFVKDKKVVVGVSGGVDSAVVTKLCVDALGSDRVLAVHMPELIQNDKDLEDVQKLVTTMELTLKIVELQNFLKPYRYVFENVNTLVLGNLKTRIRMTILYLIANKERRLVAGTGNKSELLTGYFTKYGDGAADFYPIGDLYKTQVQELAKYLKIPHSILTKVPTAGLWEGQTDEAELGIKYQDLDRILYAFELGYTSEKISTLTNLNLNLIKNVELKIQKTKHKRVGFYIPKIGARTVGIDWRE